MASVTSHLTVDSVSEVSTKFGMPGDYIVNSDSPKNKGFYKGCVLFNDPHDGLYGKGRYLVQNKGLVLYAIDHPLPDTVTGGNDTEKAIILAIAMQASVLAASSCFYTTRLQEHCMLCFYELHT